MRFSIRKKDGSQAFFDTVRLRNSLKRVHADKVLVDKIVREISNTIREGDTTSDIYRRAFLMLREHSESSAMTYSLKQSIFRFGPTGFVFEKFVGRLFSRLGYNVQTNVHLQGRCAMHEIDALLEDRHRIALEIKFHNNFGGRTDLKTALYVKARFDDLKKNLINKIFDNKKNRIDCGMLVTNTKFTSNAIMYSRCSNMKLLSWNTPKGNNLYNLIEEVDAHPITCLPSLTRNDIKKLYEEDVVVCADLISRQDEISRFGFNRHKIKQMIRDANVLCKRSSRR